MNNFISKEDVLLLIESLKNTKPINYGSLVGLEIKINQLPVIKSNS